MPEQPSRPRPQTPERPNPNYEIKGYNGPAPASATTRPAASPAPPPGSIKK